MLVFRSKGVNRGCSFHSNCTVSFDTMWKLSEVFVGSDKMRKKTSASLSWINIDCFIFNLWPNFPQKLFRHNLARHRKPGFSLILWYSNVMPSFSWYSLMYLTFAYSESHLVGKPEAENILKFNVVKIDKKKSVMT